MKSLLNNSNLTIDLVDLNADSISTQSVQATATTDSVSTSTGAIITAGGLGVAKNVSIGGDINLAKPSTTVTVNGSNRLTFGMFSTNFGSFAPLLIQNGDDIGSSPVNASITTSGGIDIGKRLNVADTTDSTSTSTGTIICAGGLGLAKSLNVGGILNSTSTNTIGNANTATTSNSSVIINGTLSLNNGTSNTLFFGPFGAAAPSFTTRSVGTKIILYPTLGASAGDHAIGVEGGATWISAPTASASIKFYQGTTNNVNIGPNSLDVTYTTDSTSASTGSIICSGGLGLSKKLFVGGGQTTIEGSNYPTLSVKKAGTSEAATFGWDTVTPRVLIQSSSELYPIYMGGSAFQVNTSGVERLHVTAAGNVGIGTATPAVKLDVVGDVTVSGILTKGGGSFLIDHPEPTKSGNYKLRHSFVESNTRGDNIYRYKVTTVNKRVVIDLPSYFQYLNETAQAFVSPVKKLCACCAYVDEELNQVVVESAFDTEFNVLVIGTRKDPLAMRYWPNGKSEEEEIIVQPPQNPSVEPIEVPMEVSSTSKPKKHDKRSDVRSRQSK